MSTAQHEMIVYDKITDPMIFVREMGESIAKSGMFGCENIDQGKVIAMACLAKRVDPLTLAETYHIIGGKLSKKADAMLRDLHRCGGSHKIICRTADRAEIEITYKGNTDRFAFTIEQAMEEPFSKKKGGGVNPNYETPRKRMQMLWARVVSDGVRATCPEAAAGTYTPEEVSDFTNGQTIDEPMAAPSTKEADAIEVPFEVVEQPKAGAVVVEQPKAVVVEQPKTAPVEQPKPVPGTCSAEQSQRIRDLFAALQVPHESAKAALAKRGADVIRNLSSQAASELIAALEKKLAAVQSQSSESATNEVPAGESREDVTLHSAPTSGPCSQQQIDTAKSLIKEASQTWGPTIPEKVKAKLQASGLSKLADLTCLECQVLINNLGMKQFDAWAELAISGSRPS